MLHGSFPGLLLQLGCLLVLLYLLLDARLDALEVGLKEIWTVSGSVTMLSS